MQIQVTLQGGFGNHMLAFFASILLARKTRAKIVLNSNEIPDDQDVRRKDTRSALSQIIKWDCLDHSDSDNKKKSIGNIKLCNVSAYYLLLSNPKISNIEMSLITIYIDDYEYNRSIFRDYIDLTLFERRNLGSEIDILESDIVVSMRLGMGSAEVSPTVFSQNGVNRLPFTYYATILDTLDISDRRIVICSDNFDDGYISKMSNDYPNVVLAKTDTLGQMSFMLQAKTIISSNSSFSIMNAILSDAKNVYVPSFAPYGTFYRDVKPSDIRLFRLSSPRFIHIGLT